MNPFERIAYWLIAGSRGGKNRARIISALAKEPVNSNRLAERLGVDYKTAQHHINALLENGFVEAVGKKYGKVFVLSGELEENRKFTLELVNKVMGDERKKKQP